MHMELFVPHLHAWTCAQMFNLHSQLLRSIWTLPADPRSHADVQSQISDSKRKQNFKVVAGQGEANFELGMSVLHYKLSFSSSADAVTRKRRKRGTNS